MNLGSAAGMPAYTCLKDMELQYHTATNNPEVYSDSSAKLGLARRSGADRIKHLDIVANSDDGEGLEAWRRLSMEFDTTTNTADLGTKYPSAGTRAGVLAILGGLGWLRRLPHMPRRL